MSLFGDGPHNESSPIRTESDAEEIQEIAESPEQQDERYDEYDDDVYSDEEADGDVETSLGKSLTGKERKRYRRWYRAEICVLEAFETARAGDLGRNLVGAASERRVGLLKSPATGFKGWASRGRWTDDGMAWRAVPAAYWTAWPLGPREVPLDGERFGGLRDGGDCVFRVKRRKVVRPSAEFEEVLCDLAVGKARERVDRESRLEKSDDAEWEGESGSSGEEGAADCDSGPELKKTSVKDRDLPADEESRLAFSADQDRAREILRPTIRSIMSKVDALATGLYHSRMNHRVHRSASHDRGSRPSRPKSSSSSKGEKKEALGLRDWSEILGMASLTGWDPNVVGRAAERCSKLFGEGMTFATLDADEASTKLHEYEPDVVPHFEEGEEGWTLDTLLCPHEDCARHAKGFDLRRRLRWHIKNVHDWDPEVEKRPKEMVGGVHLDGFMREIPAQPGWRARDKVKSEKRAGKRKKEPSPKVEE